MSVKQEDYSSALEEQPKKASSCCSRFAVYSTGSLAILTGAVLGIGFGILLNKWDPPADVITWVKLPGVLFINAIKCVILPLVFCSLTIGMSNLFKLGKSSAVGWRTAVFYISTTVCSCIEGVLFLLFFRQFFTSNQYVEVTSTPAEFSFKSNDANLTIDANGMARMSSVESATVFTVKDLNGVFQMQKKGLDKFNSSETLSTSLIKIFKQMVTSNIVGAFAKMDLLGVVMFSIPFGIALALLLKDQKQQNKTVVVLEFIRELNEIFMKMINAIIMLMPFAIFFLISSSLASRTNLVSLVTDTGLLMLTILCGLAVHTFLFYPLILFIFVRKMNPFWFVFQMLPAQIFAFGAFSSMATLPVTMKCVDATRMVSKKLSRFVLPLGATINMDGNGILYPAYIVFMATAAGLSDKIGASEWVLIIVASTVGAVGTAPVPNAALVMTMTIWGSVFPSIAMPESFSYITAIDWFICRFVVSTNVTGDAVVARIIAEMVDETMVEDLDEEEEGEHLY